jgi:hypothetical protein
LKRDFNDQVPIPAQTGGGLGKMRRERTGFTSSRPDEKGFFVAINPGCKPVPCRPPNQIGRRESAGRTNDELWKRTPVS